MIFNAMWRIIADCRRSMHIAPNAKLLGRCADHRQTIYYICTMSVGLLCRYSEVPMGSPSTNMD